MGDAIGGITYRRSVETGLCDLVAHVGRDHMAVVEVGSFAGDSAHIMLDTGKVDRIYCVDLWAPSHDAKSSPSEVVAAERAFDASFAGDPRVVKVKSTLQEAVAAGLVPKRVDMVYIDGCHRYDCVVADLEAARGMCDFLAGHDINKEDVRRAISYVCGRGPDARFSDSSWVIDQGGRRTERGISEVVRSRFDRIICLTCPQSVDTRFPDLLREFDALGLGDMVLPFPNVHNSIAHAELDRRRFANDGARRTNVKNVTLGHYSMIKFARDAGYKSVMIVEDDCRFVRPLSMVAGYLAELPESGNAALYYGGIPARVRNEVMFPAGTWPKWGRIPAGTFFDYAVCYTLGRDGMECLVDYYEKCGTEGYRWPVDACDRIWPHLTRECAVYAPHVCLVHHGIIPSVTEGAAV